MGEIIQSAAGVGLFVCLYVRQARLHRATLKAFRKNIQTALWQDRQIRKGNTPNVGRINGSDSGR